MAKKIVLPEKAYKKEGQELVGGQIFTDGELHLSDEDAARMFPKFINFYSCTVEDVQPAQSEDDDDDGDPDPSLSSSETK
jgi:hypothetical protein